MFKSLFMAGGASAQFNYFSQGADWNDATTSKANGW